MKESFLKSAYGKVSLMLILLFISLCSLYFGLAELTFSDFFGGLMNKNGYETESIIIYSVRLPRIIGAILAGTGLSVSGVLLQSVTNNPLASPNIIGVNSGAGFAVILTMLLLPGAIYAVPVSAFVGAFVTTLLITGISAKTGMGKSTIILVGVSVTALLNGGISFISYFDNDLLSAYNYFSVGSLSSAQIEELLFPFVIIALCFMLSALIANKTDAMVLGDSIAYSLGVDVKKIRIICLIISSACAGAVVSFAGLLGFVGLVVPHMARKLTGNRMKHLIPVSALMGSILVVAADLVGRIILAPTEIPVGIVMAFIGAPFFFYLLVRRKKDVGI